MSPVAVGPVARQASRRPVGDVGARREEGDTVHARVDVVTEGRARVVRDIQTHARPGRPDTRV